jgi:hypothetical protein
MAQINIKQMRGNSEGSILFLGTNSVVTEDFDKLKWDQSNSSLYIGGNLSISDNLLIDGDLIVGGDATYINTTELLIEDNYITLNSGLTSGTGLDSGIEILRGSATAASILWDESEVLWAIGLSGSESYIITEGGLGLVKSGNSLNLDIDNIYGVGLTSNNGLIEVNPINGLSIIDSSVGIGGTLSQNTDINAQNFSFKMIGSSGASDQIEFRNNWNASSPAYIQLGRSSLTISSESLSESSRIVVSSGNITIDSSIGLTQSTLFFSTTGVLFTDDINERGIEYANNYHINYTNRTLVDKEYVDNLSISLTGGSSSFGTYWTSDQDLSFMNINVTASGDVRYIDFENTDTITSQEGRLFFDDEDGTLNFGMKGGNVTQQIGQEQYYYVKNQSGNTIDNGNVVSFAGSLGNSGRLLIQKAIGDDSIPSEYVMGVTTENILNGEDGLVTEFGLVRGIDTTGQNYGET